MLSPGKSHGKLKVDGIHLKNEQGKPVILRGMSVGRQNFWPGFHNAGHRMQAFMISCILPLI